MTNREQVIEVSGLRRRYGPPGETGYEAVRGIDLSVARGELFALLGTNGAGKTSTVELLEGLEKPTAGRIEVLGHDPYTERSRVRPRTGTMLQEGGFPSELTVTETARMWAGLTSGARPTGEMLELVGLGHRRDVRVKLLSGGERRRLDLGLAVMGRPEVLFLDEPTTGMDAEGRQETWKLVRELKEQGTTVLLTTHYLEEAERLADRLAIMHKGVIVAAGTPADVVAHQPARIRFTLPGNVPPSRLPLSIPVAVDGRRAEVRTQRLQQSLTVLLSWAAEEGVELADLDARSASLEEAFLSLARQGDGLRIGHGDDAGNDGFAWAAGPQNGVSA